MALDWTALEEMQDDLHQQAKDNSPSAIATALRNSIYSFDQFMHYNDTQSVRPLPFDESNLP